MNQREKEILKLEEDLKDTIENELIKQQKENRKTQIKDIKLVGQATWQDKINGKQLKENVFIVEKEIIEIDENGKERISELTNYYLGDKCVGGKINDNEIIYSESFKNSEPDKMNAINELLDKVSEQDIENNSLNKLQRKELAEVLTAHLGKEISEDEVEKMLEEMDESETEELEEEDKERENKDENDLSEKQTEKIKVSGIQRADLNKLVDGKETLGKRLDLQQYDTLYVVYSDKVDEVTKGSKRNNTTYSLVGMTKDGQARVLNDEFEMDTAVGNNGSRESTKIRANSTATRDNNDLSVYRRKSNGMSIGCENSQGNINMFLYEKTREENENIGIQIETSKTPVIPVETREIMNRNKGTYQKEKVQDEIEDHTEEGCNPDNVEDFDGDENTSTHEHSSERTLEEYIEDIFNYKDDEGEQNIKDAFTKDEVKDKLLRELTENEDKLSIEEVINNVQKEMNEDAQAFIREHKR